MALGATLRRRPRRPPSFRPRLEALEDRLAPAFVHHTPVALTVLNLNDSGAGSLRAVLASAGDGDVISFAPGVTGTITLTSGALAPSASVSIVGPGPDKLALSGGGASQIFLFSSGFTESLSGLSFLHGLTTGEGAGGAVENDGGTVTFNDCAFAYNTENQFTDGGAIASFGGALTLNDCSLYDNVASTGSGGAVFQLGGTLTLTNTTIADNVAGPASIGGGLCLDGGATVTITACTISGNSAGQEGGGVFVGSASVTLDSTLVAGNSTAGINPDFDGSFSSQGHNLIQNTQGANFSPLPSDLTGVAPLLGALRDNGGGLLTLGPLAGSLALDAGDPSLAGGLDQRGTVRGPSPTIGAVEGADPASLFVVAPDVVTAGESFTVQVIALDAQGNVATAADQTVLIVSDDLFSPGAVHTFDASDYGQAQISVTLFEAGGRHLAVFEEADPSVVDFTTTAVLPGPTAVLAAEISSSAVQTGQPVEVALAARDAFGNLTPGFTGTVQLTTSDPLAGLPASVAFTAADQGEQSFLFTPVTGGNQSVEALASGLSPAAASVLVEPIVLVQTPGLAVTGQPYTLTLSTTALGAPRSVSTAVDWGDGEVDVFPGVPATISHVYTVGPKLRTVTATVNADYNTDLSSTQGLDVVEVLPPIVSGGLVGQAQGGGTATVALSDVGAVLHHGGGANRLKLLIADYKADPTGMGTGVNGVKFFDVLSRDVGDNDTVTVTFHFTPGSASATLEFFDTASRTFRPVKDATLTVDLKNGTVVVVFGKDSFPTLRGLSGTVFTIAVPTAATSTPTQTTSNGAVLVDLSPPTASTAASASTVQATFQSSSTLTLALAPSDAGLLASTRAGQGGGGILGQDLDEAGARALQAVVNELPAALGALQRLVSELPGMQTTPAAPAPQPPVEEEVSAAPLDAVFAEVEAAPGPAGTAATPDTSTPAAPAVWLLSAPLLAFPFRERSRQGRCGSPWSGR